MVATLSLKPPMVYPSGAALANLSAPMMPAAPVIFSITIDCPILVDIFCANNLAATSTALPTAKGKIMRIGLLG